MVLLVQSDHQTVIFEWICTLGIQLQGQFFTMYDFCVKTIFLLKVPCSKHKKSDYFTCAVKITETLDQGSPTSAAQMICEREILKMSGTTSFYISSPGYLIGETFPDHPT